jgi:hypothetical protein
MSETITITGCPLCSSPVQAIQEKHGIVYRSVQLNSLFHRLEEIRADHNGIFSIRLFMGHDGHFSCEFADYEKALFNGESGRSISEAVDRCIVSFYRRDKRVESASAYELLSNAKALAQGVIESHSADLGNQINALGQAIMDLAGVIEHLKGGDAA